MNDSDKKALMLVGGVGAAIYFLKPTKKKANADKPSGDTSEDGRNEGLDENGNPINSELPGEDLGGSEEVAPADPFDEEEGLESEDEVSEDDLDVYNDDSDDLDGLDQEPPPNQVVDPPLEPAPGPTSQEVISSVYNTLVAQHEAAIKAKGRPKAISRPSKRILRNLDSKSEAFQRAVTNPSNQLGGANYQQAQTELEAAVVAQRAFALGLTDDELPSTPEFDAATAALRTESARQTKSRSSSKARRPSKKAVREKKVSKPRVKAPTKPKPSQRDAYKAARNRGKKKPTGNAASSGGGGFRD